MDGWKSDMDIPRPDQARRKRRRRIAAVAGGLLAIALITVGLFFAFGGIWLGDLTNPAWFLLIALWLLAVVMLAAIAVVRHAEALAAILGEPLGTLVLTLAVIGIEVAIISAVMAA